MTLKRWFGVVAFASALGTIAGAAGAGPITSSVLNLRASVAQTSSVEKAASRRCWWRNGQQHCRAYRKPRVSGYRNQDSDYNEHLADKLPYGSQRWWDQMVRENRAGNPGGGGRD